MFCRSFVEIEEQAITLMKLRAKPMPIVGSQCIALPKLGSIGIARNALCDLAMDRSQKFGFGLFFITVRLSDRKLFDRSRQFPEPGAQKTGTGRAASRSLPFRC